MKMIRIKLLSVFFVAMVFMFFVAQSRQFAQSSSVPGETAGQKFKNIKVLNDIPADQLGKVMNLMSASLGVDCKMCHTSNVADFEKDDNEHKAIAREMIKMTREINKGYFEGKVEVSCNTCHNGHERPVAVQTLIPAAPVERPKQPSVKPTIEQILEKYTVALGGKANLAKVATRTIKASRIEPDGKTTEPEDVVQKAGKIRVETKYGDYLVTEAFDGKAVWKSGNGSSITLRSDEAEQIKREAQLFANPDLKVVYSKIDYRFTDVIDGREVYAVNATTADNQRERLFFDVLTGLLIRRVASSPTVIGQFQFQVDYSDYKDFGGVKLPVATRFAMPNISWTRKIVEVKNNGVVDDLAFSAPVKKP